MSQFPPQPTSPDPNSAGRPSFDPNAPHHQLPRLRPLRTFPAQARGPDNKPVPMIGLADARQISQKVVMVVPGAQVVLPLLDGTRSIPQIVTEANENLKNMRVDVRLNPEVVQQLVAQLDDAALIHGPAADAVIAKMRADFDASPVLPPSASAAFAEALARQKLGQAATEDQIDAEAPARLREVFDHFMAKALEKAENPSFNELPRGIVAPHLDYPRGWINYASVYGRLRVCDRPDRVVILGTNHFGTGTGVVACDKGFESPLGLCPADKPLADALRATLGEALFEHRYDHEREHSIDLHVPWIQHIFGKDANDQYPAVFAALIHDPAPNNGDSYDGAGISLTAFVDALRNALDALPGKTLIVSSADLSHIGPAFGDRDPVIGDADAAKNARDRTVAHDQEMLKLVTENKPSELIASMAWQQNPTRWCSTGNIVASLLLLRPTRIELLNYGGAIDQQGMAMVTSAAIALW